MEGGRRSTSLARWSCTTQRRGKSRHPGSGLNLSKYGGERKTIEAKYTESAKERFFFYSIMPHCLFFYLIRDSPVVLVTRTCSKDISHPFLPAPSPAS